MHPVQLLLYKNLCRETTLLLHAYIVLHCVARTVGDKESNASFLWTLRGNHPGGTSGILYLVHLPVFLFLVFFWFFFFSSQKASCWVYVESLTRIKAFCMLSFKTCGQWWFLGSRMVEKGTQNR